MYQNQAYQCVPNLSFYGNGHEPAAKRSKYLPPLIQTTQCAPRMMMMNEMPTMIHHQQSPYTYQRNAHQYSYMPTESPRLLMKQQQRVPLVGYSNYGMADPSHENLATNFSRFSVQGNKERHENKKEQQITPRQNSNNTKVTGRLSTSDHIAVRHIKEQETQPSSSNDTRNSNFNVKFFGNTQREKMFIFTGTVERVIQWNKIFKNHFCYYEVIAVWKGMEESKIRSQHIILLKDRNTGPILQVIYHDSTPWDVGAEDFGQMLRCIGNMIGPNILNAVSIRTASIAEVENLRRLTLICDQAVSHYMAV